MQPHFGTAGNPDSFYEEGNKASIEMPLWLKKRGLNAYEYQCSRGANTREETATKIGLKAKEYGIKLSIHAPYYINLATLEEKIAINTKQHFLKSIQIAEWMGADTVVFHTGAPGKQLRQDAFFRAKEYFGEIVREAEELGHTKVRLAPETMGKQNQLGNLEEVVELCKLADWIIPAVDFGHLHAVTCGKYITKNEIAKVFDYIAEELGETVAANIHIHFSKIEFTNAGEKKHWTFNDSFGPPFEPLIELIAERGYTPRVICESAGTQALDAKTMKNYYETLKR